MPMLITAYSSTLRLRDLMVWIPLIRLFNAITGSTDSSGIAPCPPLPVIRMLTRWEDAMVGPACTTQVPTGMPGMLCSAYTESHGKRSNRPSSIIALAPARPSSSG
ncbi:hypothetical protein D3C76_849820 [compost metagenome]